MVNPIGVISVYVIVFAFLAVVQGSEFADELTPPKYDKPSTKSGILRVVQTIGEIMRTIWESLTYVVSFAAKLLTFQVDGMPAGVRVALLVPLLVTLIWAFISLLRGTS